MSINNCVFMGRFVRDPEVKKTQSDLSVCSFTLAVDRNYTPKGEEKKADFVDFVAWRGTADFIGKYFTKGDLIAVTGELQTRTYEDKDGNKRKAVEIIVNQASFCGGKSDGNNTSSASNDAIGEGFTEVEDDGDLPF